MTDVPPMRNMAVAAIAATLLGAAGIYFAFGLGDWWWLAWLAPMPMLWLAFAGTDRRVVFACAFLAFAIGSTHALAAYGGVLPAPVVAAILAGPALLFAASVAGAGFVARRLGPLAGAAAFAALWTVCDYASSGLYNGAVMSPAYSQIPAPVFIQSAALFGPWSVTFVLGAVAAGVAAAVARRSRAAALLAITVFVLDAGYGAWRLASPADGPSVRVGLAADDSTIHQSLTASAGAADGIVQAYIRAAMLLSARGARLIVMPEKVAILEPAWRDDIVRRLWEVSRVTGATIVIGFDARDGSHRNEALVFTPDRQTPVVYLKRHFVPVLEDGYQTGPGGLTLADGTGIAICKDMDYPAMLRRDSRSGHPTLMAVPAWDFGADGLAHAEPAIMRGVENGFALARAARDGVLTLTDAHGRMRAMQRTSFSGMVTAVADVPRGPGATLYNRIGDAFAWACIALSVILLGRSFARTKRAA